MRRYIQLILVIRFIFSLYFIILALTLISVGYGEIFFDIFAPEQPVRRGFSRSRLREARDHFLAENMLTIMTRRR